MAEKECLTCLKIMVKVPKESYSYFANKKFCSVACRVSSSEWIKKMSVVSKKRQRTLWKSKEYRKKMSISHTGKTGEASSRWLGGNPICDCGRTISSRESSQCKICFINFLKNRESHLHPAWKGGLKSENEKQRKSPRYQEWRRHVFQRDDYTCQNCRERGGKLHADHELPFSLFPDLRFEILNGRTLCVPCHRKTITWGNNALKYESLTQLYG